MLAIRPPPTAPRTLGGIGWGTRSAPIRGTLSRYLLGTSCTTGAAAGGAATCAAGVTWGTAALTGGVGGASGGVRVPSATKNLSGRPVFGWFPNQTPGV